MASISYLYRLKKDQASLKLRLLFRHNDKDHQLETDSKVVITHDYWIHYHRKSKIKDVKIRNKQREIAEERSYNYHHRKLYRLMEGNTCAIQAQVKDVMLITLDCLV